MGVSSYIKSIRSSIGHDFLLVAAVTALVADDDGRQLLVRTADFGIWATIGGAVDPDEAPAQAVCREVREELGVEAEIVGLRGAVGGPDYRVEYPNGDRVGYVGSVFDCRIASGEPTPDGEELIEARWFSPSEIPHLEMEHLSRQLLIDVGVIPAPDQDKPSGC